MPKLRRIKIMKWSTLIGLWFIAPLILEASYFAIHGYTASKELAIIGIVILAWIGLFLVAFSTCPFLERNKPKELKNDKLRIQGEKDEREI